MAFERQILFYKRYFLDFYEEQPDDVQSKIEWTLGLIRVTLHVPEKHFKHMEGTKGLYEIRVRQAITFIESFHSLIKVIL